MYRTPRSESLELSLLVDTQQQGSQVLEIQRMELDIPRGTGPFVASMLMATWMREVRIPTLKAGGEAGPLAEAMEHLAQLEADEQTLKAIILKATDPEVAKIVAAARGRVAKLAEVKEQGESDAREPSGVTPGTNPTT